MAAEDELAAAQIAQGCAKWVRRLLGEGGFTADSLRIAPADANGVRAADGEAGSARHSGIGRDGFRPAARFDAAADSATAVLKAFIYRASWPSAGGPALRGDVRGIRADHARRKGRGAGAFHRRGRGTPGPILRRRPIREPLDGGDRQRRAGGGQALAGGAGTAHFGSGRGHGRTVGASSPPAGAWAAHLYISPMSPPDSSPERRRSWRRFPRWNSRCSTLKNPGMEQGFEAGAYDLVLGTNVLHAVADVRATLRHLHDLLAPGGTLMFMDVATPQLWTESVFGLTSGWWHLTDRDLRPSIRCCGGTSGKRRCGSGIRRDGHRCRACAGRKAERGRSGCWHEKLARKKATVTAAEVAAPGRDFASGDACWKTRGWCLWMKPASVTNWRTRCGPLARAAGSARRGAKFCVLGTG